MIKKKWLVLLGMAIVLIALSMPQILHSNKGVSKAVGSVRNGKLINGYLLPYSGNNFGYFSLFSYYILNNAYVHSAVYNTVLAAYKQCEQTCPGTQFKIMEAANRDGGKIPLHRTHQNGMGIDFMIPKVAGGQQRHAWDRIGIWHYALEFDNQGKLLLDSDTQLDFNTMAKHLLALDDAAQKHGLRIRKVLLKSELLDDFFDSEFGNQVQQRGIYFVPRMYGWINRVHDDHYHVDFQWN